MKNITHDAPTDPAMIFSSEERATGIVPHLCDGRGHCHKDPATFRPIGVADVQYGHGT